MARWIGLALVVLPVAAAAASLGASSGTEIPALPVLERFLAETPTEDVPYRALRHLEASAPHLVSRAWMDVWTELDAGGMRYQVIAEDGSDSMRTRVFRAVLDAEREAVRRGAAKSAALTPANYTFERRPSEDSDLAPIAIKPRRRDMLLVEGSLFLRPPDGELVRIEGRLARTPSFFIRRVDIVRRYRRLGGISMPVALESVAHLLLAGQATFEMTYDYESVNGQRVGHPQPRAASEEDSSSRLSR